MIKKYLACTKYERFSLHLQNRHRDVFCVFQSSSSLHNVLSIFSPFPSVPQMTSCAEALQTGFIFIAYCFNSFRYECYLPSDYWILNYVLCLFKTILQNGNTKQHRMTWWLWTVNRKAYGRKQWRLIALRGLLPSFLLQGKSFRLLSFFLLFRALKVISLHLT